MVFHIFLYVYRVNSWGAGCATPTFRRGQGPALMMCSASRTTGRAGGGVQAEEVQGGGVPVVFVGLQLPLAAVQKAIDLVVMIIQNNNDIAAMFANSAIQTMLFHLNHVKLQCDFNMLISNLSFLNNFNVDR